ncbi:hypothetical protein LTR85_005062 [Meristemomyces frigidus]|nr:hypothetical protein LTR85_005062 [Meristemomyces frigidus]
MAKRGRSPSADAERSEKRRNTTGSTTIASGQSSNGEDTQMTDAPSQLQTKPRFAATGPRISPALQKKILLAATSTPRYLFRTWRGQEDTRVAEGDEVIVPAAFNVHDAPQSMFDVPKKVLVTHMKSNLRGHQSPSLFSDWTHSFHAAVEKAGELHNSANGGSATHDAGVFLCVLDTHALPDCVTVLHTSHLGLLDKRIPQIATVKHKFLAYGIVPGAAYKVVEYGAFLDGKPSWISSSAEDFENFEDEVELAVDFGRAFGGRYELPVVAMCVAMYKHHADVLVDTTWKATVAERLCRIYDVPADWEANPLIMTDSACMVGYHDAMRCRALMRAMVQRKIGTKGKGGRSRPRSASVSQLAEMSASKTIEDGKDEDEKGEDGYHDEDDNLDFLPHEDSDSDRLSDDGEFENSPLALPRGAMDEATKRQLQQAAMRTPRYLFRAWSDTVRPSGGYSGLDTVKAITPLAFDKRHNCGKASIYEHTRASLAIMGTQHLHGQFVSTEFSSWGASLQVAFHFAQGRADAHISVIDTTKLPKRNVVLHVPSLRSLGVAFYGYDWEYLAHGVITGPALSVVPLSAFANIGLPRHLGIHGLLRASPCSSKGYPAITKAEVKQARKVADQYGPQFRVAVTLAILCLKQRCGDFWDCGNIKNLQVVAEGVQDCRIPEHWCKDKSIFTDVVHTKGYGEIKQMIYLLRALVDYCHGKGARGRSRSRARSVSRPNRYVRARKVEGHGGKKKKAVRFADQVGDGSGDDEGRRGRALTRPLEEVRWFSAQDTVR